MEAAVFDFSAMLRDLNIPARAVYPTKEAKAIIAVGTTKFYELVNAGEIDLVKQGSRSYATGLSLMRYVKKLLGIGEAA